MAPCFRGFLILLFAAAGCAMEPPPRPAEIKRAHLSALQGAERTMMESVLRSFVRLDGPKGSGSAMAISADGKILTAWHVVEGSFYSYSKDGKPAGNQSLVRGRYQDRPFASPMLVASCPEQDLAILDIGLPTPDFVPASARGFAEGERVFLLGASGGTGEFTECTQMKATSDERNVLFVMNAPALPGDSGGGVVNARGELLGVLVRGSPRTGALLREPSLPKWDWISVMVPLPERVLAELLRAAPQGRPTRLYLDPEPPEGRIDMIDFWKRIRLAVE